MELLDLPPELVALILEHLTGRQLRFFPTSLLLISKAWYCVALPVYLASLPITAIYLSSDDLELIPPPQTPIAEAIAAKTTRLSIRLVGHPSKQIAQKPWHHCGHGQSSTASDHDEGEIIEGRSGWDYWFSVGPVNTSNTEGGRQAYLWHTEDHQLQPWMQITNNRLSRVSGILRLCKNLKDFSFEASSEDDPGLGPRWDYLLGSSFKKIIKNLPHIGLNNLTLDTCGSALATSREDRTPIHLCPLLASRLPDFQRVRIRMRHICPDILDLSTNLSDTPSRLRSLMIRLSLPFFPEATYENHNGKIEFDPEICPSYQSLHNHRPQQPLYKTMIKAGEKFAKEMKGLDMLRISYRPQEGSGINLELADCVIRRVLYEPSENFTYEDDGRAWEGGEDVDRELWDGGPLVDIGDEEI